MADKKITELVSYSTPQNDDIFPTVEISSTTTKKISWSSIKASLKAYFDTLYVASTNRVGFVLNASSGAGTNPGDTVFNWIGANYAVALTGASDTSGLSRMYLPKACTLKNAIANILVSSTLGTSETFEIAIFKNDVQVGTITTTATANAAFQSFTNNSLNISFNAGDYINFVAKFPTWVTNPTSVRIIVSAYFE